MSKEQNIAIVGGGLVGSLLAIYMAKRGHQVNVFERRSDIRKMKIVQGKSINLALSDRGWKGLDGVGIRSEIEKVALPMHGRLMHAVNGELTYQPYGKEGRYGFDAISAVDIGFKGGCMIHDNLFFSRNEFESTVMELRLMAAPAIIGLNTNPKLGVKTPAAIGIANML